MNPRKRQRLANRSSSSVVSTCSVDRLASFYSAGFNQSTLLVAHTSCVNGLAFSHGEGRYLASGGDDKRVLIWNMFGRLEETKPIAVFHGARSNIFAINFTCDNARILSTGNDSMILMHDLERGTTDGPSSQTPPTDIWIDHDAPVKRVVAHPSDPQLFMSASEDGTVRIFDARKQGNATRVLSEHTEFNDAIYHPLTPNLIATVDGEGLALLIDVRKIGDESIASEIAVLQYATAIIAPHPLSDPNQNPLTTYAAIFPQMNTITFSPDGKLLCATISMYFPTLYSLNDPQPLATFNSPIDADGNGYRSVCTVKNGSFGGTPDDNLYYAAGSDDFRAYIWKVPSTELLLSQRTNANKFVRLSDWEAPGGLTSRISFATRETSKDADDEAETGNVIGEHRVRTIPVEVNEANGGIISGHQSIVNTTLFHPTLPYLVTCGIEKAIRVHSSGANDGVAREPFVQRVKGTLKQTDGESDDDSEGEYDDEGQAVTTTESVKTLEYFDRVLEREGRGPSFGMMSWRLGFPLHDNDDSDVESEGGDPSDEEEGDLDASLEA